MKIEEAIKRYSDNAEFERKHGNLQGYFEFKQLAYWLKELKNLKETSKFNDGILNMWIGVEVLEKIKDEIMNLTDGKTPERIWNVDVLQIIDKYRGVK